MSVVGDFNSWDGRLHAMRSLGSGGIWELFIPDVGDGERYKYEILTADGAIALKADPYAQETELPPQDGLGGHRLPARRGAPATPHWLAERREPRSRWPSRCRSTRSTSARGG